MQTERWLIVPYECTSRPEKGEILVSYTLEDKTHNILTTKECVVRGLKYCVIMIKAINCSHIRRYNSFL